MSDQWTVPNPRPAWLAATGPRPDDGPEPVPVEVPVPPSEIPPDGPGQPSPQPVPDPDPSPDQPNPVHATGNDAAERVSDDAETFIGLRRWFQTAQCRYGRFRTVGALS